MGVGDRTALTGRGQVRIGAFVALALLAGLATWIAIDHWSSDSTPSTSSTTTTPLARAASLGDLVALSATLGHPVYWAGPRHGTVYELTQTADGRVYIRYLPRGVKPGTDSPAYLTVGTYPVADAAAAVRRAARKPDAVSLMLPGGALAVYSKAKPTSVYFAYPRSQQQVEVYDPSAAEGRRLVQTGEIQPVGSGGIEAVGPKAATVAELESLTGSLGHPVYWAGSRADTVHELTRTADGRVYIRYLPRGVDPGSARAFLTVGTYPVPDAAAAVRRVARKPGTISFTLPDGAHAVYNKAKPTSVYFAYPRSQVQVEVYAPSGAVARRLVRSGTVQPIQ